MSQKSPHLKTTVLFTENLLALLHARRQSQDSLARWCHKSPVWISKILHGERQARMEDLDRIADFFGLATYQLFQPGISTLTERRKGGERRSGRDRRISHEARLMAEVRNEMERVRPGGRFRRERDKTEETG
jgi:transcriptional regulator with XRE-family HTH domain